MNNHKPESVDEYISRFSPEIQLRLEDFRATIKDAAPEAMEVISYQMPAYKMNGILVYFAGYANHIGFYPLTSAIAAFKDELSEYKGAKGSVQFPHIKPLPLELVKRIVEFRVAENTGRALKKKK